jgi:hypothetical protein
MNLPLAITLTLFVGGLCIGLWAARSFPDLARPDGQVRFPGGFCFAPWIEGMDTVSSGV